jgi:hypothetical protein
MFGLRWINLFLFCLGITQFLKGFWIVGTGGVSEKDDLLC